VCEREAKKAIAERVSERKHRILEGGGLIPIPLAGKTKQVNPRIFAPELWRA
jgi:hypothetical protein